MTTVQVLVDGPDAPIVVGQAHFTRRRGQVSTTFLYDPDYLISGGVSIDPALPLISGAQYQEGLIRAFADGAPDRWGRGLIEKAERLRARDEGRAPRRLDDVDFLLGVSDNTRQGALRYRLTGDERFLGYTAHVPKLISLPGLLRASDELAAHDDASEAVKRLLDTGTTGLGGARPKASVRLDDGALAIAKFPHPGDRWDVMAWEATALGVMEAAGIRVPERQLRKVGDRSVLILRRFDRTSTGERIGYISALTALSSSDGDRRDYAEIAESLRDLSRSPRQDHHELFNRVVASVALGNTDDHARNHGLLRDRGGWSLSPAFDVNPNPDPWRTRATTIMGADGLPDEAESLLALADECSLSLAQARERIAQTCRAVGAWKQAARSNGVSSREVAMMAEGIEPRLSALRAQIG